MSQLCDLCGQPVNGQGLCEGMTYVPRHVLCDPAVRAAVTRTSDQETRRDDSVG